MDTETPTKTIAWWLWIIFGAIYGVVIRALAPHWFGGAMSVAFLLGTPFAIGALTVYWLRALEPSWLSIVFAPWLSVALMLVGCAITLMEGSICIALLSPLFLFMGSLGGLAMAGALRMLKYDPSKLQAIAALPLLLGVVDQHWAMPQANREIRQSIQINAPPEEVWKQLRTARAIQAEELPFSWTHFIGVPRPLEGVNIETDAGEVRFSKWDKGVNFKAIVTDRKDNETITWRYLFDAHSFPPGSMDEHVEIGGRYFDLQQTTFNLKPLGDGSSNLEIVANYRVTSSVNFYAVPAAEFLGQDFIHSILYLYKGRSERRHKG